MPLTLCKLIWVNCLGLRLCLYMQVWELSKEIDMAHPWRIWTWAPGSLDGGGGGGGSQKIRALNTKKVSKYFYKSTLMIFCHYQRLGLMIFLH